MTENQSTSDEHREEWLKLAPDEFLRSLAYEIQTETNSIGIAAQLMLQLPALQSMMDRVVLDDLTLREVFTHISERRKSIREQLLIAIAYAEAYQRGEIPLEASKIADLKAIVRREVDLYNAGTTVGAKSYAILDDQHHTYAVIAVPDDFAQRPAWVVVMARVVGDTIVIDEDRTDKPLVDALMINGGIPREQIILAYAGESLPEQKTE